MAKKETKIIHLRHMRGNQFGSHYASGTIVSGPQPDGTYQLLFYGEATEVDEENLTVAVDESGEVGEVQRTEIKTERVREDRVRVSMSELSLRALLNTLNKRFKDAEPEDSD